MGNIIINKDKNIFLKILIIIILSMLLLAIGLAVVFKNSGFYAYLILINILIILFGTVVVYLVGLLFLVIRMMKNNSIPKFLIPIFESSIKLIYPIMIMFSKLLKVDKDSIRRFFSQMNNKVVILKDNKLVPEDILVIAPHCLQKSSCKYKITGNINNCRRCGACDINMLIELCTSFNVKLEIVTGGTLARKIIEDYKPKGIIAIACERDLTHGILDVKDIPVIGIKNDRPEGPCHNTCVNVNEVEKAIKHYLRR